MHVPMHMCLDLLELSVNTCLFYTSHMLWSCTNIYPGESYLIGTIQTESRILKDDSEESTTNLNILVHNKVLVSLCVHACM